MRQIRDFPGAAGALALLLAAGMAPLGGCAHPKPPIAGAPMVVEPPPEKKSTQERLHELEEDVKKIWWELRCKNDKVRDFVRDCDRQILSGGASSQCATENLEPMIQRMFDVPHVLVRLWAGDAAAMSGSGRRGASQPHSNMTPDGHLRVGDLRMAQLDERLGPVKIASTSTIYIVYQPSSDNPAHMEEAAKLTRQLVHDHLINRLHVPERSLRMPLPISCRNKADLLKRYSRLPTDQPKPDEPQAGEPQHTIWLFRVDCPPPPSDEKAESLKNQS